MVVWELAGNSRKRYVLYIGKRLLLAIANLRAVKTIIFLVDK
jgi:hypothetical protein